MPNVATYPTTTVYSTENRRIYRDDLSEQFELRNFNLDEYHQLIDIGFFKTEDRVELLEGLLIKMSPIRPAHANTVDRLMNLFIEQLGRQVQIRVQQPVTLVGMESEPEPDIVLAQRKPYEDHHPNASEISLLIEVSDTTLAKDRGLKAQIYATESIQEYWIVNLMDRTIEVHRNPRILADGHGTYFSKQFFDEQKSVTPLAFPDCMIDVSEVLPRQR